MGQVYRQGRGSNPFFLKPMPRPLSRSMKLGKIKFSHAEMLELKAVVYEVAAPTLVALFTSCSVLFLKKQKQILFVAVCLARYGSWGKFGQFEELHLLYWEETSPLQPTSPPTPMPLPQPQTPMPYCSINAFPCTNCCFTVRAKCSYGFNCNDFQDKPRSITFCLSFL